MTLSVRQYRVGIKREIHSAGTWGSKVIDTLVLAGFGGLSRLLIELVLHAECFFALRADDALRGAVR